MKNSFTTDASARFRGMETDADFKHCGRMSIPKRREGVDFNRTESGFIKVAVARAFFKADMLHRAAFCNSYFNHGFHVVFGHQSGGNMTSFFTATRDMDGCIRSVVMNCRSGYGEVEAAGESLL